MGASSSTFAKIMLAIFLIVAFVVFSTGGYLYYNYHGVTRCQACGMTIMEEMKEHFVITDAEGVLVYACCQGCTLRLLDPVKGYDQLHIETFCDWYGPAYQIVIEATDHGNLVVVSPETARILLGAEVVPSCANNRIAYNQTAVEALLTNGYSQFTATYQQHLLPEGTPVLPVPIAAKMLSTQIGIAYEPPKPLLTLGFIMVGVAILVGSFAVYRKLMPRSWPEGRT